MEDNKAISSADYDRTGGYAGQAVNNQLFSIEKNIKAGYSLAEALKKAPYLTISPEDKFNFLVNVYYNMFGGDEEYTIRLEQVRERMETIKHLNYKNCVATMAGLKIIDRNRTISKQKLDALWEQYDQIISNEKLNKADVVRYARMWLITLKQN
jgi:hypothetical protein